MPPATATWNCGPTGPKTVSDLRKALTVLANKKAGKALIADKFTKDHIYAGHGGSVVKLASALSKVREKKLSTLLITSIDSHAKAEVLNWIKKVPQAGLTYNNGIWTISNRDTAVPATASYKFATVDLEAMRAMNSDDLTTKSRKWLTESLLEPKIACYFGADGTPLIYHFDY